MPDSIHPNQRGVELLGNLVIKFVTDAQERMSRWGQSSHSSSSQLPEPLYVDAAVDDQSNTCTRGDALQDMLVHLEKWYWVDGKKPGEECCRRSSPAATLDAGTHIWTAMCITPTLLENEHQACMCVFFMHVCNVVHTCPARQAL